MEHYELNVGEWPWEILDELTGDKLIGSLICFDMKYSLLVNKATNCEWLHFAGVVIPNVGMPNDANVWNDKCPACCMYDGMT